MKKGNMPLKTFAYLKIFVPIILATWVLLNGSDSVAIKLRDFLGISSDLWQQITIYHNLFLFAVLLVALSIFLVLYFKHKQLIVGRGLEKVKKIKLFRRYPLSIFLITSILIIWTGYDALKPFFILNLLWFVILTAVLLLAFYFGLYHYNK